MKTLVLCLALGGMALAQQWEVGVSGGVAVHKNATVKNASRSGDAGFKTGPAFSVFASQNMYEHLGGELRYTFQLSDMKVSSGGAEATFDGQSHAFHYDLLFYATGRGSAVRPYLIAGGGGKYYRGTGKESAAAPPNADLAILTKTSQFEPLIVFGGGVRVKTGGSTSFRIEARDYLSPIPKDIIAPVPGASMSRWVHAFTPMVSVSFGF
jgi:hypothetical protein